MNTLDNNISESDTFLRDNITSARTTSNSGDAVYNWPSIDINSVTHGGAEEVIIKRRLYMRFEFEALWLNLCGDSSSDPIVSVAAVQAKIGLKLLPDTDTNEFDATLLDLLVEDRRHVTVNRHFTKLVQQIKHGEDGFDVCNISYMKAKTKNEVRMKVSLGSPRVVFIPDAVLEILLFFETEKTPPSTVEFDTTKSESRTQIAVTNFTDTKIEKKTIEFGLETDDCSFVLIDMGSVPLEWRRQHTKSNVEVVVMKARTSASANVVSDMKTGQLVELDSQIHC
eukprot:CAMPEP_0176503820 /NCGR_PEP_ID=MMETSP0200_2-20121128/15589_1 /TAXON_ID=947934 /ORGANISM="Chaetoceros sp., Strain GSL56" /LENGTH=281 /DNA_ID=CAMNT_0017903181 /DNA_START=6 /DNA_END=848 /DNA_ORIENTATION=+